MSEWFKSSPGGVWIEGCTATNKFVDFKRLLSLWYSRLEIERSGQISSSIGLWKLADSYSSLEVYFMPFDKNFALNVMYPAASAAYLIMNVPSPPMQLPAGFTLVGPIMADPAHAAHVMAQATPDQQRIPNAMVAESCIFGLVAWNAAEKTAIIAIRGTMTVWEWIGDFDAVPVPWFPDTSQGLVDMGFQLVYEHICLSVRDLLSKGCAGVTRILVTGHSLGGAVAVLAAFDILQNKTLGVVPEVYTFAGPRAGTPDFAKRFEAGIPKCYRLVNFMDVVPQVPVPPLYMHVGEEILVYGGFKPLNITYAHHLTTYLNGLQKYAGTPAVAVPKPAQSLGVEGYANAHMEGGLESNTGRYPPAGSSL